MIMNVKNDKTVCLEELVNLSLEEKVEDILPNFRKNNMTDEQIERIVNSVSLTLKVELKRVLAGIMLLFLQGAASSGTPLTMFVGLGEGKFLEKRNIVSACILVTGHLFIRRLAEALATPIGEFAYRNKLKGELANRINNRFKAKTGNNLSDKKLAYCSSFSQSIPDLSNITSERLAKLLAEDYQRRFENTKKKTSNKLDINIKKK